MIYEIVLLYLCSSSPSSKGTDMFILHGYFFKISVHAKVCKPTLFSLNRYITFEQRYTTVTFIHDILFVLKHFSINVIAFGIQHWIHNKLSKVPGL